ncbi:phospholipase D-like domain-containing protein [Oleiagrimonas citrea]
MQRKTWSITIAGLLWGVVCVAGAARPEITPGFQIVESVPEATNYGAPGVPRTQAVWLDMIHSAHKRIDVAAFYLANKPGSALAPVLDAVIARARDGVKVRFLLDRTFMKYSRDSVDRLRKVKNIEVRVLPMDALTGGVLHAKYMVVDGREVFVGSANWDWRALTQIHEIGARIRNARFARTFEASFDFDWHAAAHPDMPKLAKRAERSLPFAPVTAADPVTLHDNSGEALSAFPAFSPPSLIPHGVSAEQPALVRMIHDARHVLRVQVMTLTAIRQYGPKGWWTPVDAALRDAAARGVDVRIIVADWALREPMQAYLKSLAVLPHITVKFSHLPPSPQGFIDYARVEHAKYAVADDRSVYIGTGNWGWSYFNNTVDASVFAHGAGPAKTLIGIFDHDWSGPYVTTLEPGKDYKPPRTH